MSARTPDPLPDALPGLELAAVGRFLARERPDLLDGPLTARLLAGGRSNLTYAIGDGTREVVLRRAPLGHVLATAHDMAREFTVLSALAGSAVPVPVPYVLCPDPAVTGAPFYVMELVAGVVHRTARQTAALTPAEREALAHRLVDTLVTLHSVDPGSVGLAGFGRPQGYLERQVRRWGQQLDASRSRALPGVDELRAGLASCVPATRRSGVLHGDYRLDNLVVGPAGEVRAVLDWEMSTLGDVLADLGLLLLYWEVLGGEENPIATGVGEAAGFPSGAALANRYLARAGVDGSELPWYLAFSAFKLAVVLEGIHYRHGRGQTVGAGFGEVGALVPQLVVRGRRLLG